MPAEKLFQTYMDLISQRESEEIYRLNEPVGEGIMKHSHIDKGIELVYSELESYNPNYQAEKKEIDGLEIMYIVVIINSLSFIFKMLGFVFGVTLVFGLLEEVGVMARISYVFDNTMSKLGLQGKSVMPFLVSFGCTMSGAAGARVIDNWGQKVLTIALAWAIPCGAAWAVVPMLSTV